MASYQPDTASSNSTTRQDMGTSPSQGRQNISPDQKQEKAAGNKGSGMGNEPRNGATSANGRQNNNSND